MPLQHGWQLKGCDAHRIGTPTFRKCLKTPNALISFNQNLLQENKTNKTNLFTVHEFEFGSCRISLDRDCHARYPNGNAQGPDLPLGCRLARRLSGRQRAPHSVSRCMPEDVQGEHPRRQDVLLHCVVRTCRSRRRRAVSVRRYIQTIRST